MSDERLDELTRLGQELQPECYRSAPMPDAPAGDAQGTPNPAPTSSTLGVDALAAARDAANDAESRLLNHGPFGWGAEAERFIKDVERLRAAARAEGAPEAEEVGRWCSEDRLRRFPNGIWQTIEPTGEHAFSNRVRTWATLTEALAVLRSPSSGTEAQP